MCLIRFVYICVLEFMVCKRGNVKHVPKISERRIRRKTTNKQTEKIPLVRSLL
jgi:hypothetical protein